MSNDFSESSRQQAQQAQQTMATEMQDSVQKVYVVEDDPDLLDSLATIIRSAKLDPICFLSAEGFLDQVSTGARGCVLSDIRLPGMSGLSLIRAAQEKRIDIPFIVLSGFATVKKTVEAMHKGAFTFLEKPIDEDELREAIRSALLAEKKQFDIRIATQTYKDQYKELSSGEQEVLKCMLQGKPNKNIAYDLKVSLRTIEARRRKVFQKMQSPSVAELVTYTITANKEIEFDAGEFSI